MVVVHRIFMELCSFQRWDINIPGTEGLRAWLCLICEVLLTHFAENKLYSVF